MPYHVGEKGSYGCSGYPVIKDDDNTVMGCHETMSQAQNQITAINMSEAEKSKKRLSSGIEGSIPASNKPSVLFPPIRRKPTSRGGSLDSVTGAVGTTNNGTSMGTTKSNYNDNTGEWSNPKPIPETSRFQNEVETRNNISREIGKEMEIKEGDFVMGPTADGMAYGRVEHIMWEGGTLGQPGEPYSMESMPPENPAMSVRVFEEEDDQWMPTPYSIGMMYQDAQIVDIDSMTMEQENEMEMISKAETYSPSDGMKSAARRALKWKEDGEATGAGTPVGWGRARDIVAGRSMSLSVVRRMFSFFSRHEKSSKGAKGFNSGEEGYPSNGRIMWDAWGGDAGYSWSRRIVESNRDKALFADFAKDVTKSQRLDSIFKADSLRVGQMVSWNSSGGRAQGKVKRIIRSGSYNVPDSDFVIDATEDNPAVVITLYRNGKPTDVTVAHRMNTLRAL